MALPPLSVKLTKLANAMGFCSDSGQGLIARPVSAVIEVGGVELVDVAAEAIYRAALSPTVTGVASLVNCTASVVPDSTNVSVTGSTVGAGSLEFTLNDGAGGVDSGTLTIDIVGSSAGLISTYSGTDTLGTQSNPAISPFGTQLVASDSAAPTNEMLTELYGVEWDLGDVNAGTVDYGPRAGTLDDSLSEYKSPAITMHTFTVPDGQGLTEFVVSATIRRIGKPDIVVTKSVWVIDAETHYGAANTIYVSNTLTLVDEATFTAAGAMSGATYVSSVPSYNEFNGKRVLLFGGDDFGDDLNIGLGSQDFRVDSWGSGVAVLGQIKVGVNSNLSLDANGGTSAIKDVDIVNGFCSNGGFSNIRARSVRLGFSYDHMTFHNFDMDWSNLTVPDTESGYFNVSSAPSFLYDDTGLNVESVYYPTGLYISNTKISGSGALSICTSGSGSTGNIFDFVGGVSVTGYTIEGVGYSPDDVAPLSGFGTVAISATGEYTVTAPTYSHSINIKIDVETDDGVKTFYTGQCRPVLSISGIYGEIFGFGMENCYLANAREHGLRVMGPGFAAIKDWEYGGGAEQIEKAGLNFRINSRGVISSTSTNVPANSSAPVGPIIPFGASGIENWGGTFREAGIIRPTRGAYFSVAHIKTAIKACMTGTAGSSIGFAATQGVQNTTDPLYNGLTDSIVYNHHTVTDNAAKTVYNLGIADPVNHARHYIVKASAEGATTVPNIPTFYDIYDRDGVLGVNNLPIFIDGDLP